MTENKAIELVKAITFFIIGILLLVFSVYYSLFVFYPGIDYISIGSFAGGCILIILSLEKLKQNYNIIKVNCRECGKEFMTEEHTLSNDALKELGLPPIHYCDACFTALRGTVARTTKRDIIERVREETTCPYCNVTFMYKRTIGMLTEIKCPTCGATGQI